MTTQRPVRGLVTPWDEIIVREVMGYPVVVQYVRWTPLRAHRQWARFGGVHGS